MRKNYPFFLTALFLFSTFLSSLNAQVAVKPGIKAGANFGSLMGEETSSAGFRIAPQFGVFAKFDFNEEGNISFILQPELQYTGRGAKQDNVTTKLNYLELPIMSSVHFGAFYLEAGPQLGYLMSARQSFPEGKVDVKDGYRKFDLSLSAGLGLRFENGIGFGLRCTSGVLAVNKEEDYYFLPTTHVGITGGISYTFGSDGYDD